jgi:hypothetical protein
MHQFPGSPADAFPLENSTFTILFTQNFGQGIASAYSMNQTEGIPYVTFSTGVGAHQQAQGAKRKFMCLVAAEAFKLLQFEVGDHDKGLSSRQDVLRDRV